MHIQLYYFDDCPSWQVGLENLKQAVQLENISASIELIQITTNEEAQAAHFLGSPSFVVNGKDLWPEERETYYLGCRVYQTDQGLRGSPSVVSLQEKLRQIID